MEVAAFFKHQVVFPSNRGFDGWGESRTHTHHSLANRSCNWHAIFCDGTPQHPSLYISFAAWVLEFRYRIHISAMGDLAKCLTLRRSSFSKWTGNWTQPMCATGPALRHSSWGRPCGFHQKLVRNWPRPWWFAVFPLWHCCLRIVWFAAFRRKPCKIPRSRRDVLAAGWFTWDWSTPFFSSVRINTWPVCPRWALIWAVPSGSWALQFNRSLRSKALLGSAPPHSQIAWVGGLFLRWQVGAILWYILILWYFAVKKG